jgi:DNA-binding LacI/PurR family transcriptional regulator
MSQAPEKINLRKLAAELSVAPSTVSRALSGSSGISDYQIKRIRKAAQSHGYRPRKWIKRAMKQVGVLINISQSSWHNVYQRELLWEISALGREQNLQFDIEHLDHRQPDMPVRLITEKRVDAAVLIGSPPATIVANFQKARIPVVALHDLTERLGCDCIMPNLQQATFSAVQRLIELGHERIAFVNSPTDFPTVAQRLDGYEQAMKQAGLKIDKHSVVRVVRPALDQGRLAIRQLINLPHRPTACVFVNDLLALGGMFELTAVGLSVPDDMSVVSHDNMFFAQESTPPLSSIDMKIKRTMTQAITT